MSKQSQDGKRRQSFEVDASLLPRDAQTGEAIMPSEQPGYYPGYSTLSQQAFWDKTTRDLVNDRVIEPVAGQPLVIPEGAVVVPGARPVTSGRGREWGLSVATPIIVKYRDERTSARTALESWIR